MLTLNVNGQAFAGWTEVNVTCGVDQAVSSFDITLTELWADRDEPWVITPGSECTVYLDGDLVITGYVDTYAPFYDPRGHAARVVGRSKTCDVADCSADVPSGQFSGYTLASIAKALCATVGVGVSVQADAGPAFPDVQVQQGEKIFELIERLSRLRALLVCDDARGNLVLTRVGAGRAAGALVQGQNILAAGASLGIADRYSDYIVKAQQTPTDDIPGISATEVIGEAHDGGVPRHRPKIIVCEGQADTATAIARARWEAATRAARGVDISIRVQGWRQSNGDLWRPNRLVRVRSPWLGVDQDLLIAGVNYRLGNDGTICELRLAPPAAFTPEPIDPDEALGYGAGGSALYVIDQDLAQGATAGATANHAKK